MKLFLLQPAILFQARVNQASFTYPLDQVTFDTVTTGTYSNIWPNATVWFGSSAGANDLGISRVRKLATSDTLYIGRSSQGSHIGEVDLADNCYITVLHDYRVWSKTPFIDSDGERFMDSSLDFATWGADSPPVANAGPAFVGTIDPDTEVITVTFSATGSFTTEPGATIAAYGWSVYDGTITVGDTDDDTITATFPAGFRYVTLGIADSNSQFAYCHVPVLAIDPEDDPCVSNFLIERHTIRPDGQEIAVRIRESIPTATYPDGTLAILVDGEPADDEDRSNVLFMGWADQEPAEIDATDAGTLKDVVLTLVDVAGRMKSLPGFSQLLEETASPSKWGEMTGCNMDRMLHFLLQWQSTVLDLVDFTWSGTTTSYPFKILSSEGASLWEQVARKAAALVPEYALTCSRHGALRVLPDPMLQDAADRTSTVQGSLDANDYSNLTYTQQRHPRVHWLRSNAIIADSSAVNTAFSIAPGTSPGQGEGAQDDGENLTVSQSTLNAYAGHKYARLNAPQGPFRLTLAEGNDQGIDPSAMTWVQLTLPASVAAQRGLSFTNARFLCQQIDVRYASTRAGLTKTYTLTLERETTGIPATTVVVEVAEPVNPSDPLTPPVVTLPPSFDGGMESGTDNIALIGDGGEIYRTSNFTDATPDWETYADHQSGFGGAVTVYSFVVDPFSPKYRTGTGAVNGFMATGGGIWKIEDIFGTASVTNLHVFDHGISTSGGRWRTIAASFGRYQATESDNPWIMVVTNYGNNTTDMPGCHAIYSVDGGQTWSSEIEVTGQGYRETGTDSGQQLRPGLWLSPRTPGYAITFAPSQVGDLVPKKSWYTTNWGVTWTEGAGMNPHYGLGGSLHVPWPNNADEEVAYYGRMFQNATYYDYYIMRKDSATSVTDISPIIGGESYGLRNGLFGVRTYDNDRRYVAAVLFRNGVDDLESNDYVGVFRSEDYGNSWTQIVADIECNVNTLFPLECAFAADDPEFLYIWGNEAYIKVYDHGTVYDKRGDLSPGGLERVVGLVGG